jgi:hypothetical protein
MNNLAEIVWIFRLYFVRRKPIETTINHIFGIWLSQE